MRILSIIPVILAIVSAYAAEVKISDLPETNAPSASAVLPIVDAGVTWKVQKNNLLGSLTNWAKLATNVVGGSQLWTNLPSATDMEGGTVSGAGSLNVLTNDVISFAVNDLQTFWEDFSSAVSIGYPLADPVALLIGNADIKNFGDYAGVNQVLTNSGNIYNFGYGAGDSQAIQDSLYIFNIGNECGASQVFTNCQQIYNIGMEAGKLAIGTNSSDIFNFGRHTATQSTFQESHYFLNLGVGAGAYGSFSNVQDVVSVGFNAGREMVLSDSSDILSFGTNANKGFTGSNKHHIAVIGSGGMATNSNDFVFGDSAYNYFFPGASSRFDHDVTLMDGLTLGGVRQTSWPAGGAWTSDVNANAKSLTNLTSISSGASPASSGVLRMGTNLPSGLVLNLPSQSGVTTNLGYFLGSKSIINDDGSYNELFDWGYNLAPGPLRASTNDTAVGYGMEGRWDNGGVPYAEMHMFYIDKSDTQWRPFSWTIRKDTTNMSANFLASSLNLFYPDGQAAPGFGYLTISPNQWVWSSLNDSNLGLRIQETGDIVYLSKSGGDSGSQFSVTGFSAYNFGARTIFTDSGDTLTTSLNIARTGTGGGMAISTDAGLNKSFFYTTANLMASDVDLRWADTTDAWGGTKSVGIGWDQSGILRVNNGGSGTGKLLFRHQITVGTAVTLSQTNEIYLCNVDAQTITLPTAASIAGRVYTIKTITPAATATIATTSSQLIDGASTYSLSASNKFVRVVSDGTNWWNIGSN